MMYASVSVFLRPPLNNDSPRLINHQRKPKIAKTTPKRNIKFITSTVQNCKNIWFKSRKIAGNLRTLCIFTVHYTLSGITFDYI